jgi:O-antigen/teichoic acid export membrane protein
MTLAQYLFVVWIEAAAARFYADAAEKGEKPAHFATLIALFSWCAGAFALISIAALLLWPADLNLKIVVAAAFGSVITRSLIKIALETRRMAQEAKRFAVVDTLHTLLAFGLGIGCVVFFAMGPEGPFIGMLIASVIVLAIEGPALWMAARKGSLQPERGKAYFAYGAPLAGGLILSLVLTSGDRFVIAAFLGEGDVGAYSAGYQVGARILDIIFTWGAAAVTPILIAAYERGGAAEAVAHGETGFVIDDPNDHGELASRLAQILDDAKVVDPVAVNLGFTKELTGCWAAINAQDGTPKRQFNPQSPFDSQSAQK